VYTIEALEDAKHHLKPGGVLWLNIWVPKDWVLVKFAKLMRVVFASDFFVLRGEDSEHYALIAGKEINLEDVRQLTTLVPGIQLIQTPTDHQGDVTVPTDDWPYVFYRSRQLPVSYLALMASLIVVSTVPFLWVLRRSTDFQWDFFFLGAGFLLVETSAVIRMALVAGTTWLVNSAVFAGVLIFAFLANWAVARWHWRNAKRLFVALFLSLLAVYIFPFPVLLELPNTIAVTVAATVLTVPIFFAGMVYSTLFRQVAVPSQALASNLLGAMVGGFSEYLSMLTGNRLISLQALALYFIAFVFSLRRGRE